MKSLLLCTALLAFYLGYQLVESKKELAVTSSQLEIAQNEVRRLTPKLASGKTWLQQKIEDRSSSLDAGAYNRQTGVARRASIYYSPTTTVIRTKEVTVPSATPED